MRVFLLFLLALVFMPLVPAQDHMGSREVTVYARESGCPDDKTFCFVLEGSLDDIEAGDQVTFTLVNEGETAHELVVVPYSDRDPDHQATDEATSLGEIEEIGPGETDTGTFTVPGSGLYFFCALAGHEQLGMWVEAPTEDASEPTPVGILPAVAAIGLAASLRRR